METKIMETTKASDNNRVLCIGDSISKGFVFDDASGRYSILKDNYVSLLERRFGIKIRNVSRFGNTLPREMERYEMDVLRNNPQVVMISFGGNDCDYDWTEVASAPDKHHNPKTDISKFREMLCGLIDNLLSKHITPILMTLPPIDADRYFKWISRDCAGKAEKILKWLGSITTIYWWHERYNAAITWTATKTGIYLADVREAFLEKADYRKYICTDGIHPNSDGHKLIAEKLSGYLPRLHLFKVLPVN